jgi:uncharacterized protein YndB with AHSA1/START domain
MSSDTDRIIKTVVLKAAPDRVWRAISDVREFGSWFGAAFDGPFIAGTRLQGTIVPTTVDPEVAKMQEPHAGTAFEVLVERVEPMRLFSFRWHPYSVGTADLSAEPMTLVEFELTPADGGTRLTITESGFDSIPLARRAKAFKADEGGWEHQARLVAKYLAREEQA